MITVSSDRLSGLERLRDDSHFIFYSRDGSTTGERTYLVRYAAYQTLKEWGVDVRKPVYLEAVR